MEAAPRFRVGHIRATLWQAPLVPVALAVTTGIVADRYITLPLPLSLIVLSASLALWCLTLRTSHAGLPLIYLAIGSMAAGAAYHHWWRHWYPADHICRFLPEEPSVVRLRGSIVRPPFLRQGSKNDPLRPYDRPDRLITTLDVSQLQREQHWLAVSGLLRLTVVAPTTKLRVGDEIEAVGQLSIPPSPSNPGEMDYASVLRDERICAVMSVQDYPAAVTVLAEGQPRWFAGWLGTVREWAQGVITSNLPVETSGVAVALLLGEGSAMAPWQWDRYQRTGVIHVLAVSGQHLMVLAGFLWLVLRFAMVRRRQAALLVAVFLLAYAMLTGSRPPVVRAVVMACTFCGAIYFYRIPLTANTFALGWLAVIGLNPTDIFDPGCQLSFLSVAVLYWGTTRWLQAPEDPLDRLIEESMPAWRRFLRWAAWQCVLAYAITSAVWLAVAPLISARYHLLSPIALLLGPPTVLLASAALINGFLLLVTAAVAPPVTSLFALVTHACIAGCESLVTVADQWPCGHRYVSGVSEVWLWVFYAGLLAFLLEDRLHPHWRWALAAGGLWLCIGLAGSAAVRGTDELRCTFLAVGHGGCTVIETPDRRVLLYDAGAITGPEVTHQQIAPFLWSRGIRRIDELFISHADLDHFNGIPALLDRFVVAQISCTPTFDQKNTPAVAQTLGAIRRAGTPVRIVQAGDRLAAGEVKLTILHPPEHGPVGQENCRSLVLHIQHEGNAILLTGDLEGAGLQRVVRLAAGTWPVRSARRGVFENVAGRRHYGPQPSRSTRRGDVSNRPAFPAAYGRQRQKSTNSPTPTQRSSIRMNCP
jgi:competence protein ComEC